jgi:hypothetical protein
VTRDRLKRNPTALDASVSIFLIIVGGILALAVQVSIPGINLNTVGVILLVVGIAGVATSVLDRLGLLAAMLQRMGVPFPRQDDDGESHNRGYL